MRRIDRKKADPEMLREYEAMRYDRRRPILFAALTLIAAFFIVGFMLLFFVPQDKRPTISYIWLAMACLAIIGSATFMVAWQPPGRRLRVALIIMASLLAGVVLLVLMLGCMYLLASLL